MALMTAQKILQVLPALGAGGVEQGTLDLNRALVKAGAVSYVAASQGFRAKEVGISGGHFVEMPLKSKNPFDILIVNPWRLWRLIKKEGIRLVHARSRGPAWSAYLACKLARVPFVTTFHGAYNFNSFLKKFYNSVMVRGDRVIGISDFIRDHILEYYGGWVVPENLRRIYRGVDIDFFNPEAVSDERVAILKKAWHLDDQDVVFLMPGRLTRWKGQETAIRALSLLKSNLKACLVIVGSDQGRFAYRQELQMLAYENGVGDRVKIVEHCQDMPAAYSLSSALVHASTDPEAFGRVVAEGMAMGLPCLVSDLGAPREIIELGRSGWLVPAEDERALAHFMKKVINLDEEERRQMGRYARQRVEENFSSQLMCDKTIEVYQELLN